MAGGRVAEDISGKKYHRLVAIARATNSRAGRVRWSCLCECGKSVVVERGGLVSGKSKSCGCLKSELARWRKTTHGWRHDKTGTHRSWRSMKGRCLNKRDHAYAAYGGRGITVCEKWMEFVGFLEDMGARPSLEHSLGRKNNDGAYCKGNCSWETIHEQSTNKRNTVFVSINGERVPLIAAATNNGISVSSLRYHTIYRGLTAEAAVSFLKSKDSKRSCDGTTES